MQRDPRKPRYRAPQRAERPPRVRKKDRPLDLTPAHPSKGWRKEIWKAVVLVLVPTLLLWGCDLEAHPYTVRFSPRPTEVRFDGKPAKLDASGNLTFPRWTFGTHTIEYRDATGGEMRIAVHPRLDDNRMIPLNVREDSIEGFPAAEFVPVR